MHYAVSIQNEGGDLRRLGTVVADIVPRIGETFSIQGSAVSKDPAVATHLVVVDVHWYSRFDLPVGIPGDPEAHRVSCTVVCELAEHERPPTEFFCECKTPDDSASPLCGECGDTLR